MNWIVCISTTALYIKLLWEKYRFFFLMFIYICAGEHDDNIISLHEMDWKIKINNRNISLMFLATLKIVSCLKNYCYHDHDNRHIVKSLCLPQSLCQNVLTEFEYQLLLEFLICIESMINYKYPNDFNKKWWNFSRIL